MTGSGASGGQLSEFTNYWNTNYPKSGTPRSVAALFSGKSTGGGLSGIAWVTGSVCGDGNDYSFNQISAKRELALGRHAHRRPRDRPQHGLAAHALLREPRARPLLGGRGLLHGRDVLPGAADDQRHDERDGHDHGLLPSPRRLQLVARLPPAARSAATSGPALDTRRRGRVHRRSSSPPPPPPPPVSAATGFNPLPPCRVLDTRNVAGAARRPVARCARFALVRRDRDVRRSRGSGRDLRERHGRQPDARPGDLAVYPNGLASPPGSSTVGLPRRPDAREQHDHLPRVGRQLPRKNNASGSLDLVVDVNGYYK